MPGFPHSLIGLTPFVNAGFQVIFTQTLVIAFDANDKAISMVGEKLPDHNSGAGLSSYSIQRPPAQLGNSGYLRLLHMIPSWMPSKSCTMSLPQFVIAP